MAATLSIKTPLSARLALPSGFDHRETRCPDGVLAFGGEPVGEPRQPSARVRGIESPEDLFDIPLDGSQPRGRLTSSVADHSGTWAPHGASFAYVTGVGEESEVWLRHAMAGWVRPLASARSGILPPETTSARDSVSHPMAAAWRS